jgi:iron complex transport system ATP-binding protein
MLDLKNVQVGYKSTLLTIGTIQLRSGTFYSLIGKNGIGKTTFLETILGLLPPIHGEVYIDKLNVHKENSTVKSKLIAHVSSRFEGIPYLKTKDFIAMGRAPYTNFLGKLSTNDWEIIDLVSRELGIVSLLSKDTSQLSDGERQIASIAKAIVQQTPVIVLDEPTAFLDYSNRILVQHILQKIAHEQHVCIIQSSHDLELSLEYSDEILLIDSNSKKMLPLKKTDFSKEKVISIAFN